ncbi:MAG: hypothetical protein ACJAZ8_002684, partial [Planctomycetota bacterium]
MAYSALPPQANQPSRTLLVTSSTTSYRTQSGIPEDHSIVVRASKMVAGERVRYGCVVEVTRSVRLGRLAHIAGDFEFPILKVVATPKRALSQQQGGGIPQGRPPHR